MSGNQDKEHANKGRDVADKEARDRKMAREDKAGKDRGKSGTVMADINGEAENEKE